MVAKHNNVETIVFVEILKWTGKRIINYKLLYCSDKAHVLIETNEQLHTLIMTNKVNLTKKMSITITAIHLQMNRTMTRQKMTLPFQTEMLAMLSNGAKFRPVSLLEKICQKKKKLKLVLTKPVLSRKYFWNYFREVCLFGWLTAQMKGSRFYQTRKEDQLH